MQPTPRWILPLLQSVPVQRQLPLLPTPITFLSKWASSRSVGQKHAKGLSSWFRILASTNLPCLSVKAQRNKSPRFFKMFVRTERAVNMSQDGSIRVPKRRTATRFMLTELAQRPAARQSESSAKVGADSIPHIITRNHLLKYIYSVTFSNCWGKIYF